MIKYDCPDSLVYVTNQGGTSRSVTFFLEPDDNPTFYYVEKFSPKDFFKLIYTGDIFRIATGSKVQDFVFSDFKDDIIIVEWMETGIAILRKIKTGAKIFVD